MKRLFENIVVFVIQFTTVMVIVFAVFYLLGFVMSLL